MATRLLFACSLLELTLSFAAAQGLGAPPVPPGNPMTPDKVALGKVLFWDEQLSSTRTVACGTCHVLEAGGIDPRTALSPASSLHPGPNGVFGNADDVRASAGIPHTAASGAYVLDAHFGLAPRVTPRRAPTVINAAFAPELFWDGRAAGALVDPVTGAMVLPANAPLEVLALEPPVNSTEMGHVGRSWSDVLARISASTPLALSPSVPPTLVTWIGGRNYPALYAAAFGSPGVSASRTAMALASYMRTLVADQTPFDLFMAGNTGALSAQEQFGLQVFQVARCDSCHTGVALTNHEFRYTGVRPRAEDLGRGGVPNTPPQPGAMKVPDLRNLALRAPYFHNGGKATLNAVLDFYSTGGDFEVGANDLLAAPIFGVNRTALLAFLQNGLTDPRVAQGLPPFDHPALSAGTVRTPLAYGAGTAGSGGVAPRIHALEPTRLGATDFTVGISRARAGALAGFYLSLTQDLAGSPFLGATLHIGRTPGTRLWRLAALQGTGATAGYGSVEVPLPNLPVFAGTSLFGQWTVVDPHAGGMLAASGAIELRLF